MQAVKIAKDQAPCRLVDVDAIERDITEEDERIYEEIISTELTDEQQERIASPPQVLSQQEEVLAVHWHPEFVPMDLIRTRMSAMYPNRVSELVIPTQHNIMLGWDGYAGVEVDCYSGGFNRKVQLLLHFEAHRLEQGADTLLAMLDHTFKYRTGQLFDFMHSVISPSMQERVETAAARTNTDADLVEFARIYTTKLQRLIEDNWSRTPRESIKNKLLRNFFDQLRPRYGERIINKTQVFLKAVKALVKENFSLKYFYRASEVIEEARSLGAGIVIPHPEQFWPILLAGYDVDGIEVWNPQSREYTEFLIQAVNRQNEAFARKDRPMLVFMGDDTHFSEKAKDPSAQDPEKAARELGFQPAWDDLVVRKSLILTGVSRAKVIDEYKARLAG